MKSFTESIVEEATLAVLGRLGWTVLHGPEIAAGTAATERSDPGYRDVVLERRLRAALARLNPSLPAATLDDALRTQHEVCAGLFHGFDHRARVTGDAEERLALLPAAQEHILAQDDGKARLLQAVTELSAAFVLSVPADEALAIRDDVGFFQAVRAVLAKGGRRPAGYRRGPLGDEIGFL